MNLFSLRADSTGFLFTAHLKLNHNFFLYLTINDIKTTSIKMLPLNISATSALNNGFMCAAAQGIKLEMEMSQ